MQILSEIQPNRAYIVDTLPTHAELCEMTSPGNGVVYTNSYSVTHKRNNKDIKTYILPGDWTDPLYPRKGVCAARIAVAALCGIDLPDVGFTFPKMARQVSAWLDVKESPAIQSPDFVKWWHFQHCNPCIRPNGYMHDMIAAYWQIACKAPSLLCRVDVERERVRWLGMTRGAEERWNETKQQLQDYKRLRLSIIGVNATGWINGETKSTYYAGGELKPLPGKSPTSFQTLAQLTVRVAYELTQLQHVESASWYSNADCIVSEQKTAELWRQLGIAYSTKHRGDLDIRGIGTYRIGEHSSKPFELQERMSVLRGTIPSFMEHHAHVIERPVYHSQLYH